MLKGREALKNKFNKMNTAKASPCKSMVMNSQDDKEEKTGRNWMNVNEKVSKKDMDKIDLSTTKGG